MTNKGLTAARAGEQSPHVIGGGAPSGFSLAHSRRTCSVPVAASVKPKLSSRALTSLSPSAGWIPACAQAAVSALSPIRLLRPSSELMRVFGFELSKATLIPNSPASLSSSGKAAGAADVTIVSISTAFANVKQPPAGAFVGGNCGSAVRQYPQAKLAQPMLNFRYFVRR